jgi:hypothetical protein
MADDTTDLSSVEYLLTTVDNPFNPFTQFDEWLAYDTRLGYHTPSLLARVVVVSDDMSEPDQAIAIQEGIDEVVRENVSGMHKKVSRDTFTSVQPST